MKCLICKGVGKTETRKALVNPITDMVYDYGELELTDCSDCHGIGQVNKRTWIDQHIFENWFPFGWPVMPLVIIILGLLPPLQPYSWIFASLGVLLLLLGHGVIID